jgi:hypothetical protein
MKINLLIFLSALVFSYSCGNHLRNGEDAAQEKIIKIPVLRDQVYDLSGYADEGGGNPYNLFDENAYVDPRYHTTGEPYVPVTNCQPAVHPAIYFPAGKGSRIVIDLLVPCALKEIYFYDRSASNDSVWIYTGTLKKWKAAAALETVSDAGARGWKKLSIEDRSRFVMVRFSSYETDITEMVLYGIPLQKIPPAKPAPGFAFTREPLNRFLGVNYIMEEDARWLKPFHYSRLYNFALDYDNDTIHQGNAVCFNMLHYGSYHAGLKKYVFDIDTLQKINQGNIWFSIRGVSKWMSDLGYDDKDRPVNRPGLDPEDPASYSRHARMMWNLAAFFGNKKVDTGLLSIVNEPRQSGRGSMSLFENGNEEDAWWVGKKYCSPVEYFAQSTADLDGDEGRLGKQAGIRNADPGSRLMMSGLVGLDTNRVKVYKFLSENLRSDSSFLWQGGIQYHYYCNKNGKGISPEADSLRWRLAKVRECSRRIAPGVECILGENGYDKGQASRQATPLLPGYSAAQSQGIMLLRSINAAFFSGFDAYILYWLKDSKPADAPDVYLTSGILRQMPDGKTIAYPGWYYISMLVSRLGNYIPDQVISEKGNVWIYRYRNRQFRDSVAYFVYTPTVSGTKIPQYALSVGNTAGQPVRAIHFTHDSDRGSESVLHPVQGKVVIGVGEMPVLVLCKEGDKG